MRCRCELLFARSCTVLRPSFTALRPSSWLHCAPRALFTRNLLTFKNTNYPIAAATDLSRLSLSKRRLCALQAAESPKNWCLCRCQGRRSTVNAACQRSEEPSLGALAAIAPCVNAAVFPAASRVAAAVRYFFCCFLGKERSEHRAGIGLMRRGWAGAFNTDGAVWGGSLR